MKTTIENLSGEMERVSLPEPLYESDADGRAEDGTGIWYTGLFFGPRTGRTVVRYYSIWEDRSRPGCCQGTVYQEVDRSEFLRLCSRLGVSVPERIEAAAGDL